MTALRIAIAQKNFHVGALESNTQTTIEQCNFFSGQADLLVFSELSITAYPPEDLLLRRSFIEEVEQCIKEIQQHLNSMENELCLIIGAPVTKDKCLYNAAIILRPNQTPIHYYKQTLPNYGVFDEQRYFTAGTQTCVFDINQTTVGLSVCEDIWTKQVVEQCTKKGAELVVNLNASPFQLHKHKKRINTVKQRVIESGIPIIYVNQVGGQDELVFDGHSFALNSQAECIYQAKGFAEESVVLLFKHDDLLIQHKLPDPVSELEQLYQAIVLATRDYVQKNGFKGVLLGLSGGIDSALVLAIAVDALGADAVKAVMMPYHYTAEISLNDAEQEAKNLGVEYSNIAIHEPVKAFMDVLAVEFEGTQQDATEENLQARTRGVILMALSNKLGKMLLTTGNKSEMSVGYATLYGDMAGGFAPLKDVSKQRVFELAKYRNSLSPVIPQRVITRPPSAELSLDQKDEDSLPPYDVLDPILEAFIEKRLSVEDIIQQGFDADTVRRVIRLVLMNEYKRRQSPPGVKISENAFGKERRYPISSGFKG